MHHSNPRKHTPDQATQHGRVDVPDEAHEAAHGYAAIDQQLIQLTIGHTPRQVVAYRYCFGKWLIANIGNS